MPKWINEDGSFEPGWEQNLPAEHREFAKDTKDIMALVKRTKDLRDKVAAVSDHVAIPKEPAEIVAFAQQHLGAPKSADGYGIQKPATLPEGVVWDDAVVGRMLDGAVKAGIPAAAMQAVVQSWIEGQAAVYQAGAAYRQKAAQTELQAREKALKDAWGAEYAKNLELARRGFRDYAPESIRKNLADSLKIAPEALTDDQIVEHLKYDPVLAQMCRTIGDLARSDVEIRPGARGEGKEYVPAQPNAPEIYANLADTDPAKQYFIRRGYDFNARAWTRGAPTS
jgi:hypothetical protein